MQEKIDNFTLEALLGSFTPTRLDMRLYGPVEQFGTTDVTVGSLATIVHETFHFYQTIFSGYGHISWDSNRQITSYVSNTWRKLPQSSNGKKFIPLANYKFTPTIEAESFLLQLSANEQLKINSAKYFRQGGYATLKEMGLKLIKESWQTNPIIEINGQKRYLQGKDIIEGHAHYVERTFLEKIIKLEPTVAWDRTDVPLQYLVAYDWFLSKCGENKISAFPIICDLAIQTSWGPVIPKTEDDWRSTSPAWRFVELTSQVVKLKDTDLLFSDKLQKNYKTACNAILRSCNFLDLDSICDERLKSLKRKPKQLDLEKLMYEAMLFKKRNPWCLVNPAASEGTWAKLHKKFKAPMIILENGIGRFGKSKVSGSELVMELQFQAFAAQILGDFSKQTKTDNMIECAFAKYKISNGCLHQTTNSCSGRYDLKEGAPHPYGCSLEGLFNTMGFKSEDIELDVNAKFNLTF